SQLLYDLPPGETYRIIFMERDLDEVLQSQEKMLARLGRAAAPREEIMRAYALHLERLHAWLARQENMVGLRVSYNDLVEQPRGRAEGGGECLGGRVEVEGMVKPVDPTLYRNRRAGSSPNSG